MREHGDGRRGPRLEMIPPPLGELFSRSPPGFVAVRGDLETPLESPVLTYQGDFVTSGGSRAVAELVAPLAREVKDLIVVFAYRAKSARASEVARSLAATLDPRHVRV